MRSKLYKIFSVATEPKILAPIMILVITAANIKYPDQILNNIPLYFSIGIMFLAANANRYTYLSGGFNALLYGVVYLKYGLFASFLEAVAFSSPLQLFTFLSWSKRKYKHSVEFRSLTKKQSVIFFSSCTAVWLISLLVLKKLGASEIFLDSTSSALAIINSLLCLCRFKQFIYFQWTGVLIALLKYIFMLDTDPELVGFMIYHVYALICVTKSYFSIRKLYTEQKSENVLE